MTKKESNHSTRVVGAEGGDSDWKVFAGQKVDPKAAARLQVKLDDMVRKFRTAGLQDRVSKVSTHDPDDDLLHLTLNFEELMTLADLARVDVTFPDLELDTSGLDTVDPETHPSTDAIHFRRIVAAREALEAAEQALRDAVAAARDAGDSWTSIGAAMGTTRQGAYQRFGKAEASH